MLNEHRRRVIVAVAALLAVALAARLGWWQLDRAAQKTALQQAIASRTALPLLDRAGLPAAAGEVAERLHRRVEIEGRWLPQHTVFLDNRQMQPGRTGFFVLTPLQLADGSTVLVQRGWVPRDLEDRTRLPQVPTPGGEVRLLARIAPAPARLYEFEAAAQGRIRQNLALESFARETGLTLRPFTLLQLHDAPTAPADGLRREWPLPAVDVHKHYGYAFQWFALAALLTGLYVWFQLIAPRRRARA